MTNPGSMLAKRRWKNVSKKDRIAHMKMMVEARKKKRSQSDTFTKA